MRPPEFWTGKAEGRDKALALQALLQPPSWLYSAIVATRVRAAPKYAASIPVVCIGNLTLGGAGKTPVTRALRAKLGAGAHVLLRGYGGANAGARAVSVGSAASDVGDEALLHATDGATIVSRNRAFGARFAETEGARALLMDDGFQNTQLKKDLSLVVVDAQAAFGNARVFPAGPLREPIAGGLARADAVVLLHSGARAPRPKELAAFSRPVLEATLQATVRPPPGPLVAFAGIARPEKFFDTLTALGADLSEAAPYPDHHAFSASELKLLRTLARERGATLITTEKDFVRLAPADREGIATLPVVAKFDDEAALDALLAPVAARMQS